MLNSVLQEQTYTDMLRKWATSVTFNLPETASKASNLG